MIFRRYKGNDDILYAVCEHDVLHPCAFPILKYMGNIPQHKCDGCCKYITKYAVEAFVEGIEEYKV
jgi:hypothetical protein